MVHVHAHTGSGIPPPRQLRETRTAQPISAAVRRKVRISPFWQHFLEMFFVMWLGMAVGGRLFRAVSGLSSSEAFSRYPWQSVLSMGLSMTVPMVAWMLWRGHGRRNSMEMAAAMLVPGIPFIVLCSVHVLSGGVAARGYMMLSIPAMLGLMFYRKAAYSMPMGAPWHRRIPLHHQ